MDLLAKDLNFNAANRHVLCMGHIINLVAQKVLFGTDVESFEYELESTVTTEVVELMTWRKKGPIGKLHNLIRYICHSSTRIDVFLGIQKDAIDPLRDQLESQKQPLCLIRDNLTRWNSWYDATVRAIYLRYAIDEFIDRELVQYNQAMVRHERWCQNSSQRDPPKAPPLIEDKLSVDDWDVIATYVALLKPLKQATMKLQGNVSTTARRGRAVKGAIWQVLPVFSDLLKVFEDARDRHLPTESQHREHDASPANSPLPTPSPIARRTTRSSQHPQASQICATTDGSDDSIAGAAIQPANHQSHDDGDASTEAPYLSSQHHFNHNINAAWQKLNHYYLLSDATVIYRAAVFLHPRMKWRWFERHWVHNQDWITTARDLITALWENDYKHLPSPANTITATAIDEDDEWLNDDDTVVDQLWLYEHEPHSQISVKDSPIDYWISKRSVWPQLSQMAIDVYSTPAMSDEPERVFSEAGNLLTPRRRTLGHDSIEQMLCLKNWQGSGIVQLDQGWFNSAVGSSDNCVVDEDLTNTELTNTNLLYLQQTQRLHR